MLLKEVVHNYLYNGRDFRIFSVKSEQRLSEGKKLSFNKLRFAEESADSKLTRKIQRLGKQNAILRQRNNSMKCRSTCI